MQKISNERDILIVPDDKKKDCWRILYLSSDLRCTPPTFEDLDSCMEYLVYSPQRPVKKGWAKQREKVLARFTDKHPLGVHLWIGHVQYPEESIHTVTVSYKGDLEGSWFGKKYKDVMRRVRSDLSPEDFGVYREFNRPIKEGDLWEERKERCLRESTWEDPWKSQRM